MNPGPITSHISGEDLEIYRRVRIDGTTGKAVYADAVHNDCIGTVLRPVSAALAGKNIADVQDLYSGLHYAVASEAITIGEEIAAADDGKVKDCSAGEEPIGVALEAASGNNSIIRVKYTNQAGGNRVAAEIVTATNVITAAESGTTFFLNSATEFVSTLPAPAVGLEFDFIVSAAPSGASYTIVTNASANVIKGHVLSSDLNNAADADFETAGGDTITFVDGVAVAGDRVRLISDGTTWFAQAACTAMGGITITTAS